MSSSLSITEEQMRLFFERARTAERLTEALEAQLSRVSAGGVAQKPVGAIDDRTKQRVISTLSSLKEEVVGIEAKVDKLEKENAELTTEKGKLEYRITHMQRAIEQYQPK